MDGARAGNARDAREFSASSRRPPDPDREPRAEKSPEQKCAGETASRRKDGAGGTGLGPWDGRRRGIRKPDPALRAPIPRGVVLCKAIRMHWRQRSSKVEKTGPPRACPTDCHFNAGLCWVHPSSEKVKRWQRWRPIQTPRPSPMLEAVCSSSWQGGLVLGYTHPDLRMARLIFSIPSLVTLSKGLKTPSSPVQPWFGQQEPSRPHISQARDPPSQPGLVSGFLRSPTICRHRAVQTTVQTKTTGTWLAQNQVVPSLTPYGRVVDDVVPGSCMAAGGTGPCSS
ncbi:hypothetical protein B0J13DRAFT_218480 [Dactylonectria estremocensis]|uniref:Uncharacterized protein n=1 Tax=Dactylonectria estremocensis TaxID=1079267 RepID=A0A9P9F819_9HYPO|nr:hypothetical protein B0J13DRAFT_218480 [Dactylonectria estremocensis]